MDGIFSQKFQLLLSIQLQDQTFFQEVTNKNKYHIC